MTDHTETLYEERIRINSYDCDINGTWKPAAFFQHMTEAAHLHAARLGAGYDEMIQRDVTWVLARIKLKFLCFPHIGEHVIIRTWPKIIQQKLFYIRDFELDDPARELLAQATSAWLIINTTTRRLVPPRVVGLELPGLDGRHGLVEPLEKIDLEPDEAEHLRAHAGYSSVDIVGHANNSRYVEWICDAFPFNLHQHQRIDWMQVNYIHEVLPGEDVSVRARQLDEPGKWGVIGVNLTSQTTAFESLVQWEERAR
jgi:acyl-ACP thioesterase